MTTTTKRTRPDARCPECGSVLELVRDGLVAVPYSPRTHYVSGVLQPIDWRLEPRPFAACTGCEWCQRIR